jgi:hypothetical protein
VLGSSATEPSSAALTFIQIRGTPMKKVGRASVSASITFFGSATVVIWMPRSRFA